MYKLAIFDMDGTILNSLEDIKDCCNMALADFGYPTHELEPYKYFVGNGARMLVKRSMPEEVREDDAQVDRVLAVYTGYYAEHGNDKTGPYPGIVDALKKLKANGVRLAVVSNKPNPATRKLAQLHFPGIFDLVYGERPGIPTKPAPDTVLEVMREFGASGAETAYFGDSSVDMMTGKNAGAFTTGVLWGFRPKSELVENGADRTIDKVEQICDLVLKND